MLCLKMINWFVLWKDCTLTTTIFCISRILEQNLYNDISSFLAWMVLMYSTCHNSKIKTLGRVLILPPIGFKLNYPPPMILALIWSHRKTLLASYVSYPQNDSLWEVIWNDALESNNFDLHVYLKIPITHLLHRLRRFSLL